MSLQKTITLKTTLDDRGLDELQSELNAVDRQQEKVSGSAKKASSSIKEIGDNGGAISTLDSLTGGLATRIRDAFEASKLFNVSLKATRTALIATGIGAFVVALGLIVGYWDEIVNFISGANIELERQRELQEDITDEAVRNLEVLDKQDNILKLQGKSQSEINKLKKDALNLVIEEQKESLRLAKIRLEELQELQRGGGNALESFFKTGTNLLEAFARTVDGLFAKLGFDTGFGQTVEGASGSILESIFGTEEELNEAKQRVNDIENSLLDAQNRLAGIQLSERSSGGDNVQRGQVTTVGELTPSQLAEIENAKIVSDAKLDLIRKRANEEEIIESALSNAKVNIAQNTLSLIAGIVEEGSAVGKGIAVAQATISGIEGVQNAFTTASKSPITTVFPAYPFIQAGLAGAFSALQIKKILSTDPSGRSAPSPNTSGGGGGQSAPSFNVVGTSGTNQLAQSLSEDQNPVQAYVVGSNVTTQQELDRNIVDTATIG